MKKNMKVVIIIILIIVGIGVGMLLARRGASNTSEYSAVYLTTGDMYFGKLSWFPHPHLTNVWLLQRGVNAQNQPQFAIVPFKTAAWGPADELNVSEKQIIFWTSLRSDSQIVKGFDNPESLQSVQPQALPGNPGTSPQNPPPPQPKGQ